MAKRRGPGEKMTRPPRTNNTPDEDDPQTRIEREMAASGRTDLFPHEGLVGAHTERRVPSGAAAGDDDEGDEAATAAGSARQAMRAQGHAGEGEEPTGPGSDVAPTARATERERERHRLERERGRIPAGEEGLIRDTRSPDVTRADLDEAARQADAHVGARIGSEAEGAGGPSTDSERRHDGEPTRQAQAPARWHGDEVEDAPSGEAEEGADLAGGRSVRAVGNNDDGREGDRLAADGAAVDDAGDDDDAIVDIGGDEAGDDDAEGPTNEELKRQGAADDHQRDRRDGSGTAPKNL